MDLGFIGHLLLATRSLLFKPHLGSLGINKKNGDGPRRSLGKKNLKIIYVKNNVLLRSGRILGK